MKASSLKAITSSRSDEWATDPMWYDYLNLEFKFTLDPAATFGNTKCKQFFTKEENGLTQSWAEETVFLNPPYSQISEWMRKAYNEAKNNGALVVCLVPARVDTVWWHKYATRGERRFPKGRLKFVGAGDASAPFPSAIVIFRPYMNYPKHEDN